MTYKSLTRTGDHDGVGEVNLDLDFIFRNGIKEDTSITGTFKAAKIEMHCFVEYFLENGYILHVNKENKINWIISDSDADLIVNVVFDKEKKVFTAINSFNRIC